MVDQRREGFRYNIQIHPAWDKRNPDPSKDFGVGCVGIRMTLVGPNGAVHFAMSTGIALPHVAAECAKTDYRPEPFGQDVGYHSPVKRSEWQLGRDCDLLPGGKCYCDGSALRADEWKDILIREGSEKIWRLLEQDYDDRFGGLEDPTNG